MPSPAVEDYLKAIHQIGNGTDPVGTSALADRLDIAPGSVTGMLKRLAERKLVEHVPYYGARLTPAGEREAVRMIRRHRVLERFLVDVLGFGWDEVHEEAERLEHAASDVLVDRMAQVLGEPDSDPHGDPIPMVGERFVERSYPSLAELDVGRRAVLRRVSDEDPEALRYLAGLELTPGAEVRVLERSPFNGPLRVQVGAEERILGRELSSALGVEPIEELDTSGEKTR